MGCRGAQSPPARDAGPCPAARTCAGACPARSPAWGFMASLRPGEGLRPGLRWEGLMSAWQPLLDFCPEQCWGKQAQPHRAEVTQDHAGRATGPGPFLKSAGTSRPQPPPASKHFQPPYLYPSRSLSPGARGPWRHPSRPCSLGVCSTCRWEARFAPLPHQARSSSLPTSSSIIWYLSPDDQEPAFLHLTPWHLLQDINHRSPSSCCVPGAK